MFKRNGRRMIDDTDDVEIEERSAFQFAFRWQGKELVLERESGYDSDDEDLFIVYIPSSVEWGVPGRKTAVLTPRERDFVKNKIKAGYEGLEGIKIEFVDDDAEDRQ